MPISQSTRTDSVPTRTAQPLSSPHRDCQVAEWIPGRQRWEQIFGHMRKGLLRGRSTRRVRDHKSSRRQRQSERVGYARGFSLLD